MTIWELTRHRLHATNVVAIEQDGRRREAQRLGNVHSALGDILDVIEIGDLVRLPDEEAPLPGFEPTRTYWVLGLTNERGQTRVIGRAAGGMQN
jgi:hypothetical protein